LQSKNKQKNINATHSTGVYNIVKPLLWDITLTIYIAPLL